MVVACHLGGRLGMESGRRWLGGFLAGMCHVPLADSLDLVLRKDKALTRNHLFRQAKFCLILRIIRPNIQDYPRFRILLRGFPSNKSLSRKSM